MTLATSTVRAIGALSAGLLTLGMLSACTPAPEPDPKPTKSALFASDEEAFKAAEETYQAYTDALNNVDTTDPKTFEPILNWTTGKASSALKKSLSELHAEEVKLTGSTSITSTTPLSSNLQTGDVSIHICADVSKTDVLDANGRSLVPDGRVPIQSILVDLVAARTETGLRISSTTGDDATPC